MVDVVKEVEAKAETAVTTAVTAEVAKVAPAVTSFVAKHDFAFLSAAFVLGALIGHIL